MADERYFSFSIISALILISGNLPVAQCHAELPESDLTDSSASQREYNICCHLQECTNHCESIDDYEILETIANEVKERKYTFVKINIINIAMVPLNTNVSFSNFASLTINGEINPTNISCEASGNDSAGIVLSDVDLITLNNLRLIGCGSLIQNTNIYTTKNNNFISALTMARCRDVQINRLTIAQSKGTGLTILHHRGGTARIKSSTFEENTLPQSYTRDSTSPIFGGGGVYMHFDQIQENSYSPMTFQFDGCLFANNTARNKHFSYFFRTMSGNRYGEGGGVYLSIGHTSGISNVSVSFLHCTFANNYALVGGGLSVEIYGKHEFKTTNISVVITDSGFQHNGCHKKHNESTCFGGGAYFSLQKLSEIENCHYQLTRVLFFNNSAQYGGGVFYQSARTSRDLLSLSSSVLFCNCSFHRNRAQIGSAVDMTPNIFHKSSSGYSIVPTFKNCNFLENGVFIMTDWEEVRHKRYTWKTPGLGTIRTSHQNIHFQGHTIFESNWGTALYVVSSIVNFQNSSASFVNNTGLQGGAIALVDSAIMVVGPHDYVFNKNTAYYQGGAIYVLLIDHFDIEVSRSCFIRYADDECDSVEDVENCETDLRSKWKANITFTGNHVLRGTAGSTIYATSLYACRVINNGTKYQPEYILVDPDVALTERGIQIECNYSNCDRQIATDGAKFHVNSPMPLRLIPGEEFSHGITVADELDQEVRVPFRVAIHDPFEKRQLSNNITSNATYVEDVIQLMGYPNQAAILNLHTLSARQIFLNVSVTLVNCPPGFVLKKESRSKKPKCVCNTNAPVGIFKCNSEKFHSHLLPGYWAGFLPHDNHSRLVTSTCPFCDYSKMSKSQYAIDLPQSDSELNEKICGDTRTGIVCGSCKSNYTVHFHSPDFKCKAKEPLGCRLGWLFYILSEIVPVAVLFIIVLIFNISFTSGTISGFILFSQLLVTLDINAGGIIKFTSPVKHSLSKWAQGYQILYGFFSFDFFNSESLSFCIMTNASALDMIAFRYVTILYTLLLILSFIWIMNKCGGTCCAKFCRITTIKSSVVHGISSFLVMCYTQCVQVSMYLLNPVHFNVELDSGFNPPARVWLNGDIEYFRKGHLIYALPALFCLLTIGIFPPALLLCYPLLNKVAAFLGCDDVNGITCLFCHKISVSYLKPLLDSFQSCFKDNMRFFAGLYFLYRWIILLVFATTQSYSVYYSTIIGGLAGILALHALCQPYVKRAHNIIDTLLIANLIIISCLSFYNYHRNHYLRGVKHSSTTLVAILQLMLIYLPLIVLGVYILMRVCKMAKKRGMIASDKLVPRRANKLREFVRMISTESEDNDTDIDDHVGLTHDQLMDEDVEFDQNTCDYFNASDDTEILPLNA